jgi:cytochrome c553
MSRILLGSALTLALISLIAVAVVRLGLVPVNADGIHSSVEGRVMPVALHASIARHASTETNPLPLNGENLKAGADTYNGMCARCHGTPEGAPSAYGQSFYPPAPQLKGGLYAYTDAQLFWTIKHGIRNTGMPAWGSMLSDEEIWQVVTVLKNPDGLLNSVDLSK